MNVLATVCLLSAVASAVYKRTVCSRRHVPSRRCSFAPVASLFGYTCTLSPLVLSLVFTAFFPTQPNWADSLPDVRRMCESIRIILSLLMVFLSDSRLRNAWRPTAYTYSSARNHWQSYSTAHHNVVRSLSTQSTVAKPEISVEKCKMILKTQRSGSLAPGNYGQFLTVLEPILTPV